MLIRLTESKTLDIQKTSLSPVRNSQASVLYEDGLLWLNLRDVLVTGKMVHNVDELVIDLDMKPEDLLILRAIEQKYRVTESGNNYLSVIVSKFTTVDKHSQINIGSIIDICLEISFKLLDGKLIMFGQAEEIVVKGHRFCGD